MYESGSSAVRFVPREQIKFVPSLRSWISCCKDRFEGRSLFIGDIVALQPGQQYTYYQVNCGVVAVDYSERLTMIVTGGLDSLVRLWNPNAVGNKLVGNLEGHASPITTLIVNNMRNQLISISENKVHARREVANCCNVGRSSRLGSSWLVAWHRLTVVERRRLGL